MAQEEEATMRCRVRSLLMAIALVLLACDRLSAAAPPTEAAKNLGYAVRFQMDRKDQTKDVLITHYTTYKDKKVADVGVFRLKGLNRFRQATGVEATLTPGCQY